MFSMKKVSIGLWPKDSQLEKVFIIVKFELVKYGNHPAKLEESMKFGILVYFYLYFTILRVPERSNETGPLILSPKGP